ncbi:MAG: hypothetical protein QME46_06990 [Thermoanaerobacteraceae bacterium]|nr:hypothetical protein [Thermoanaerobacteraceae bacterium]
MKAEAYPVIHNKEIRPGYYTLEFEWGKRDLRPGQFVTLSIDGPGFPLRRPFTIYGYDGSYAGILYKVAGQGTHLLASLKKEIQ